MTVAAIVLAATPDAALADADGVPAVGRIADVAWAGGALPIVVVAPDPDGAVAAALAGSPVTLTEPDADAQTALAHLLRGGEVAHREIVETDALIVWPARFTWVDPETVTSLIEAHGARPRSLLRPAFAGEPGWPILVPLDLLSALRPVDDDRAPGPDLVDVSTEGLPVALLELGDPGTLHDRSTPRDELPPFEGPPGPASGHVHEWGEAVATSMPERDA